MYILLFILRASEVSKSKIASVRSFYYLPCEQAKNDQFTLIFLSILHASEASETKIGTFLGFNHIFL